ncbi:ORC-CDC6 family AAA ATPase [Pedobacter cryoconitis]|uniref:Uncharacterized protein n=1 Tax=Pedobacter cryoconitis TaxID=188932 RepID=A0A327RVU5_9SPHI|nr:hypothetical protein [Pedobacter cryoconitis]RAJ19884.1 hypothetical protein LY11_05256 [Pedobacter cryoconitis]
MREIDSFYNTYNARHLNPKEVAESFIFSNSFEKLIQNNHSVILGARGCGKTTLMKMLTLPALNNWKDSKADNIRFNIPFYAIYISTDIYWDVKNQTFSSELESFGNFSDKISAFSVNSNVFTSICDTFKNIIDLDLNDSDEDKEIELSKTLIKAWQLTSTIPKLEYIKDALNERVDFVNQLIQNVIFNYKNEEDIPKHDFFNLTFETSLEVIIPIFERIYDIKGKKKWALCFDELEFAPIWLQKKLFSSLRSRTQYILYKLSSSPILSLELEKPLSGTYRATSGNDVTMIKMWSSGDTDDFSKKIIDSYLFKKLQIKDAKGFFGSNEVYNKSADSYKKGSRFFKEMSQLIKKDFSFRDFLSDKRVDLNNPTPDANLKDVLFRKIKPIVYFRNYYINENKKSIDNKFKVTYRSRKTSELYFGIEVLIKICDGNPRWLIAIINSIIANSSNQQVSEKFQYDEIISASKRFQNVIANIPIGSTTSTQLTDVIDRVGKFFKNQILGITFNLDPKGTFIVDENKNDLSEEVVRLLEKGISQGAFILVDSNDDSFDFKIRGQRLKLSYLFFPLYDLPIRKYTSIKLSECLKGLDFESQNQILLF